MTRGKLLLVEDDKTLAELLIWHFEREEYDVRRTADGEVPCCSPRRARPTSSFWTG